MFPVSRGTGRTVGVSLIVLSGLGVGAGCGAFRPAVDPNSAPRLQGLGNHHFEVTTENGTAQEFFDQGLILAYAFNHAEAGRSFREAARIDPSCAMAYWGQALVLGPNVNARMEDTVVSEAYQLVQKARALRSGASEKERELIEALSHRYGPEPVEDRSSLDRGYADAMAAVAETYPADPDIATLYAEALMVLMPWDYWQEDGRPKPDTETVLASLERAIALDAMHPGANHLYIHAVEEVHPEMAVAAAERLGDLAPEAGHLVHMPSHIFIRVGRYHEGSLANEKAIEADRAYLAQCREQGIYPIGYVPHNYHFLAACAGFEGDRAKAVEASHVLSVNVDHDLMKVDGLGTLQHYWINYLYTYVRFGMWEEILREPRPAEDLAYPEAVWHFARGMALARTGDPEAAAAEHAALLERSRQPEVARLTIWDINPVSKVLAVADAVLAGEIAAARGDFSDALERLHRAVEHEADMKYNEPPDWLVSTRLNLGAVLLEAGRPGEAERVFQDDLRIYPENGWALRGLETSLRAQGRAEEAERVRDRFETAWKRADIDLDVPRL